MHAIQLTTTTLITHLSSTALSVSLLLIMTRTARAVHPRAVAKDASISRNGLNGNMRKGGAGAHNWGTVDDEARYEFEADAYDNEAGMFNLLIIFRVSTSSWRLTPVPGATDDKDVDSVESSRPALPRMVSEEERTKAIATRKRALSKGGMCM